MERLKMQTPNQADINYEKLVSLFPTCVTETVNEQGQTVRAIDAQKLAQEINSVVLEQNEERYQFTWPDKRKAILAANTPINATLRPCREESVNFDTTQNLYIEGDNLEVLKCLKETYSGKVKMIYIDPPYNTGNDFVYEDDFAQSADEYLANSGQYDEQGNRLVTNTESNGRFHTDWLNMIYPRLKVARDLLTDDGVIFISIDDHETANLKKICDEVFGESNFVANLVWEQGRKSMATQVAVNHEYCLIYCKNKTANIFHDSQIENKNWCTLKQGLDKIYAEVDRLVSLYGSQDVENIEKGLAAFYKSLPNDDPAKGQSHYKKFDPCLGIYYQGDISQGTGQGGRFTILHPITGKPCKCPSGGWRFSESKLPELLANNRIAFGKDETTVPCLKRYLKETEFEVFASVFYKDGRGASKRLDSLFGKHIFDYPKDEEMIKNFISLVTSYDESTSLVLDFFSGSATTAHAVMQLNAEDGGHRKFIMVQLPENLDENLAKVSIAKAKETIRNSIEFLNGIDKPHYLTEIGKERIRRAGKKILAEHPEAQGLDTGFRVLKLDSTNMKEVYYAPQEMAQKDLFNQVDNVKPDRSSEDLLFQVMLELGATLDSKISTDTIDGKTVYNVAEGFLIACFDTGVTDNVITAIAKQQPQYAVLRDSSYADDSTATNFEQIFKTYSPNTGLKTL